MERAEAGEEKMWPGLRWLLNVLMVFGVEVPDGAGNFWKCGRGLEGMCRISSPILIGFTLVA